LDADAGTKNTGAEGLIRQNKQLKHKKYKILTVFSPECIDFSVKRIYTNLVVERWQCSRVVPCGAIRFCVII